MPRDEGLLRDAVSLKNNEELVTHITLLDDEGVLLVIRLHLTRVRNGHELILVNVAEQGHLLEEFRVCRALLGRGILHDPVEALPVEFPQRQLVRANNASRAGTVVEQCKLAEDITHGAGLDELLCAVDVLEALNLTLLDQEHALAISALLDDANARLDALLLEGKDYGVQLLLVKRREQKAGFQALFNPRFLFSGLLIHWGDKLCFLVP
mmetsp:Transcript_28688/g.82432  ORF Transcript_28688/g.82432 Transcript_28688/m.82432 type:complete len:210 (+) Transcript_28688:568-1197(+)